jgi:ABC-type uncharacterized transport system involved in gliding motility auxiliary subunit
VVVSRGYQAWDLTRGHLYTLAPQSVLVAHRLDSDLVVTGFFRPSEDSERRDVEALLGQYQAQSKHVVVRFVDPDTNAALAQRLGVTISGSLALQYKDKQPVVLTLASETEQDVTGAILKLESNRTPEVCWADGEGERDLAGQDANFGYSEASATLQSNNYKTSDFLLAQQKQVPASCDVLAIVSLQRPLSAQAVQAVQTYLDAGGKLLLAVDPWVDSKVYDSVSSLLKPYGLSFTGAFVVDPDPAHSAANDPTTPVVVQYGNSPIARNLSNKFSFFPQPTAIVGTPSSDVVVSQVATTSGSSYSIASPRDDLRRQSKDASGPFTILETVESQGSGKHARVVLVGTSAFAENRVLPPNDTSGGYNVQVFLGAMDWLSEQEDLISIPPKPDQAEPLALTDQELRLSIVLTLLLLPLAIGAAGLAVWFRRRRLA